MPNILNIDHVANLAQLSLTTEQKQRFGEQLSTIVAYMETLASVDTEGIAPLTHPTLGGDTLREDTPSMQDSERDEHIREAFPNRKDDTLIVPAVFS